MVTEFLHLQIRYSPDFWYSHVTEKRTSGKAAGTVLFGLASVPGGTNVGKKIDDKESLRWYTKVKENLENMSKL